MEPTVNVMIYVITTSANLEENYELRKTEYIKGLNSIVEYYKINPFIIESIKHVDYFPEHYVGRNDYSENKTNTEFVNIENFFKENDHLFNDEDHIIKTTLRYEIISPYFLTYIENNPQYDVYCKSSADIYGPQDTGVHTFLFSMKYRCWKEFLSKYFDRTTHKDYPIESQVSSYVKNINVNFVDKLDIIAAPHNHRPKTYKV